MMQRVRAAWHEQLQGFYITGTTTSAGSVTTFIASALAALADDFLNEKEIIITSGDNAGVRRKIADWVSSTFTGTLLEQFPYTVPSGVTFEIGEAGFWSDQDIIAWLNDGAYQTIQLLSNEALWDYLKSASVIGNPVGSENYGRFNMPSDCIKPPRSVWINGKTAKILGPENKTRFDRDDYIGTAVLLEGRPAGGNVQALYKPSAAATVQFQYAPTPTAFDFDDQTTLPARFHTMLVDWATKRGWEAKERGELAAIAEKNFVTQINAANIEATGQLGGNQAQSKS